MRYLAIPLLISILAQLGCSSALYFPTRHRHFDPAKTGRTPEDVWFKSEDGTKLSGWYFKSRKPGRPKGVLVYFHGNAENISTHFINLLWILDHGFDFFIFDYRGYGRSEGEPNPRGTMEDGKAALRWAHSREPKAKLIVFGQSLGGAIAMRSFAEVKNEVPVRLVAVESTFASYRSVAAEVLSQHWFTWIFQPLGYVLMSDRYAPHGRIAEISPTPLLVLHGDTDETVRIRQGEKVFEEALEPKEFWRIPGGHHIDAFAAHGETYRKRFLEKLNRVTVSP